MTNTRVEAVLQGVGDGARLEQIAADLLRREDYEVDPTGTRGPDGGRDSLLSRGGEQGILHCSAGQNLESKIHDDAKKAANRPEDFDFFFFATTQNPAGVKRDRLEEEIRDQYGWRVKIWDLERLRNRLVGTPKNHDLLREHLRIEPGHAFEDPSEDAEEFYEECLSRLHERKGHYGTITDELNIFERTIRDPPIFVIHMVPAETFGSQHNRLGSELPKPPLLRNERGASDQFGDCVITGSSLGINGEGSFDHYVCFHEDGWGEAITVRTTTASEKPQLSSFNDLMIVEFLQDAVQWYQETDIHPPFEIYITLLDAAEYTISVPERVWPGPRNRREMMTDEIQIGRVTLESYDDSVTDLLRKPLYRLWNKAGWSNGSPHYTKLEGNEREERTYEWNPVRP